MRNSSTMTTTHAAKGMAKKKKKEWGKEFTVKMASLYFMSIKGRERKKGGKGGYVDEERTCHIAPPHTVESKLGEE